MITNNTNTHKLNPPYKHFPKALFISGFMLCSKGYTTRTRISIGGVQDRDTLIEQSPNYYNRTFSVSIIGCSVMPNLLVPIYSIQ